VSPIDANELLAPIIVCRPLQGYLPSLHMSGRSLLGDRGLEGIQASSNDSMMSLLTRAADENLRLIKAATHLLPPDLASKAESALRIFGADRALLLVEGVAVAKLLLLSIAYPFRRRP
jgi:hypothetical protein